MDAVPVLLDSAAILIGYKVCLSLKTTLRESFLPYNHPRSGDGVNLITGSHYVVTGPLR
jgi:hypothetical protein